MNELSLFEEQTVTTKELAEQLHTTKDVVLANAKKCLPNKRIEQGKPTLWNKAEVTVILDYMKTHASNNRSVEFNSTVENYSTELTPALKIKKAFDLMQEGYEEELARLRDENNRKQAIIDRIANGKGCFTINQTAKALKLPYGNKTLFSKLREMNVLNGDNSPRQEQVNSGHFKVVVKSVSNIGNVPVTLTTGKGLVYLAKRFNTEIDENVRADA